MKLYLSSWKPEIFALLLQYKVCDPKIENTCRISSKMKKLWGTCWRHSLLRFLINVLSHCKTTNQESESNRADCHITAGVPAVPLNQDLALVLTLPTVPLSSNFLQTTQFLYRLLTSRQSASMWIFSLTLCAEKQFSSHLYKQKNEFYRNSKWTNFHYVDNLCFKKSTTSREWLKTSPHTNSSSS